MTQPHDCPLPSKGEAPEARFTCETCGQGYVWRFENWATYDRIAAHPPGESGSTVDPMEGAKTPA